MSNHHLIEEYYIEMAIKRSKPDGYSGFKVKRDSKTGLDVIDMKTGELNGVKVADISKSWFWDNYVTKRKPIMLKNATPLDFEAFKWNKIAETLDGDDLLQVEELVSGGFGSGKKRLNVSFSDFKKRIDNGECLYMTTQYETPLEEDELVDDFEDDDFEQSADDQEEEEEEESDEGESIIGVDLEDIYQPPLDFLVLEDKTNILEPIPLSILEGYKPQQINLWIGNSEETTLDVAIENDQVKSINKGIPSKATSSGLHHDHADNLYTLIEGEKTFSIWSPDCAHDLYTIGDVRTVYNSGIIDYIKNDKAPNWSPLNERGILLGDDAPSEKVETDLDPPSFSRIPPSLLHLDELDGDLRSQMEKHLELEFPLAKDIVNHGIRVALKAGDCLYLPAGWFHEVSSSGKHIAINHWFHIPKLGE